MLLDNLRHQLRGDEIVSHALLAGQHDVDQHVVGTQPAATGLLDIAALADLGLDALLRELGFESVDNLLGTRGKAAGSGADHTWMFSAVSAI